MPRSAVVSLASESLPSMSRSVSPSTLNTPAPYQRSMNIPPISSTLAVRSGLRAMLPCSRASSRRLGVGASVLSPLLSSAIAYPLVLPGVSVAPPHADWPHRIFQSFANHIGGAVQPQTNNQHDGSNHRLDA